MTTTIIRLHKLTNNCWVLRKDKINVSAHFYGDLNCAIDFASAWASSWYNVLVIVGEKPHVNEDRVLRKNVLYYEESSRDPSVSG